MFLFRNTNRDNLPAQNWNNPALFERSMRQVNALTSSSRCRQMIVCIVFVLGIVTTSEAQWYRPSLMNDNRPVELESSSAGLFSTFPNPGTRKLNTETGIWDSISPHRLIYLRDSTMIFMDSVYRWHLSHDAGKTLKAIACQCTLDHKGPIVAVGDTVVARMKEGALFGIVVTHDAGASGWQRFGEPVYNEYHLTQLVWLDSVVVALTPSDVINEVHGIYFIGLNNKPSHVPLDSLVTHVQRTSNRPVIWYGSRPSLRRYTTTLDGLTHHEFPSGAVADFGDMLFLVSKSSAFYTSRDDGYTWHRFRDSFALGAIDNRMTIHTYGDSVSITLWGVDGPRYFSDSTFTTWGIGPRRRNDVIRYSSSTLALSKKDELFVWRAKDQAYCIPIHNAAFNSRVLYSPGPAPHSAARTQHGTLLKFFPTYIHRSINDGDDWDSIPSTEVIIQGGHSNGLPWKISSHLYISYDDGLTWTSVLPDVSIPSADSFYVSAGYVFIARRDGLYIRDPNGWLTIADIHRNMRIRSSMVHNGNIYMIIDGMICALRDTKWIVVEEVPDILKDEQVVSFDNYFYSINIDGMPIRWRIGESATVLSDDNSQQNSFTTHSLFVLQDLIAYNSTSNGLMLYDPSPTTSTPWIRFAEPVRQNYRLVAYDNIVDVRTEYNILLSDGPTTVYNTLGSAYDVTVSRGQFTVKHLPRGVYTLPIPSMDRLMLLTILVP